MPRRILVLSLVLAISLTAAAMASIQKNCDLDKSRKETHPQLAIDGLDPVLLISGEEVNGKESLSAVHAGFLYHFASGDTRRVFESDPDSYGVQPGGFCPVRPDLPGRTNIYLVHEGRIYLFHSEHCLDSFQKQASQCVPL